MSIPRLKWDQLISIHFPLVGWFYQYDMYLMDGFDDVVDAVGDDGEHDDVDAEEEDLHLDCCHLIQMIYENYQVEIVDSLLLIDWLHSELLLDHSVE